MFWLFWLVAEKYLIYFLLCILKKLLTVLWNFCQHYVCLFSDWFVFWFTFLNHYLFLSCYILLLSYHVTSCSYHMLHLVVIISIPATSLTFFLFCSHGVGWAGWRYLVLSLKFTPHDTKIGSVWVDLFAILDTFPVTEQFWTKCSCCLHSDSVVTFWVTRPSADVALRWPGL